MISIKYVVAWLLVGLLTLLVALLHINTWKSRHPYPTAWEILMYEMNKEIFYNKVVQLMLLFMGPISIVIAILNLLTANKSKRR